VPENKAVFWVITALVVLYLLSPIDLLPMAEFDDTILSVIYILYMLTQEGKVKI